MSEQNKLGWGNKSVKLVHAFEQLDAINGTTDENKTKLLEKYGSAPPLNFLLSLNFKNSIKLDLPEGMPPLSPKELDSVTHPDMIGALSSSIHRIKNCLPNNGLQSFKKQDIFIQILLACPLKDAEIVCSAKDKSLVELYPTITAEFVKTVFPHYVD